MDKCEQSEAIQPTNVSACYCTTRLQKVFDYRNMRTFCVLQFNPKVHVPVQLSYNDYGGPTNTGVLAQRDTLWHVLVLKASLVVAL